LTGGITGVGRVMRECEGGVSRFWCGSSGVLTLVVELERDEMIRLFYKAGQVAFTIDKSICRTQLICK